MRDQTKLDRASLLEKLEPVRYEKEKDSEISYVKKMSITSSLLALAQIDHEQEYRMCRNLAEHLLGKIPETEDFDLEEQ